MSLFSFFSPGTFPGYIRSQNGLPRLLTKPHFRYHDKMWQMIFRDGDKFRTIDGYTVADICEDYARYSYGRAR